MTQKMVAGNVLLWRRTFPATSFLYHNTSFLSRNTTQISKPEFWQHILWFLFIAILLVVVTVAAVLCLLEYPHEAHGQPIGLMVLS